MEWKFPKYSLKTLIGVVAIVSAFYVGRNIGREEAAIETLKKREKAEYLIKVQHGLTGDPICGQDNIRRAELYNPDISTPAKLDEFLNTDGVKLEELDQKWEEAFDKPRGTKDVLGEIVLDALAINEK